MSNTKGHDNRQYKPDLWSCRPNSMYGTNTKISRKITARIERQQDKQIIRNELEETIMNISTVQEIGMINNTNLCNSCCHEQPICRPCNIIFGSCIGNDNIVACDIYKAIEFRNPKHNSTGEI